MARAETAEEGLQALGCWGVDHLRGRTFFDDHTLVHEDDAVGDIAREAPSRG